MPTFLARGDLNGDGKVDLATAHDDPVDGVGVLLARPGLCTVQDVRVVTVAEAKRMLARANCRLGKVRRASSERVEKGLIRSQKPKPEDGAAEGWKDRRFRQPRAKVVTARREFASRLAARA